MPADVDSLAALGELASTPGRPEPGSADDQLTVAVPVARPRRSRPSLPPVLASMPVLRSPASVPALAAVRALPGRTQLVALAAGSVAAGLLAGLVVPVASAASMPSAAASALPPALPRAAARTERAAAKPAVAKPVAARPAVAKPVTAEPPTAAATRTSASAPRASSNQAASLAAALPALASVSTVDWSTAAVAPTTTRTVRAATAPVPITRDAAPTRPTAATIAQARAYKPTRRLPADSGTGRRIVYSQHKGHVWVVGADGRVVRDYPVTGRIGRPAPGSYRVFSKSPTAVNPNAKVRFDLMVRFAHGITGAAIGFHTIPRWYDGRPIQRENQLGQMIGAGGCVRQSKADAHWLYRWASVGDRVVVLA